MFKSVQTKYYLQSIALRSKNRLHTSHIDNCYFYIVELENRNKILTNMVNEKEAELIKRGLSLSKLSSEVNILKTKESAARDRIDSLEKQLEVLKENIKI